MLTSAGGILALLKDQNQEEQLKVQLTQFALRKLDLVVDEFWAEISDSIQTIEVVSEDDIYPAEVRQQAALVASKVYYHLGSYEDSLQYALGADTLFDISDTRSQYVETIIAKCIDSYTAKRTAGEENIDKRLETIVDRMFDRCFQHGQYRQALGIAIETRRLDVFEKAVSGEQSDREVKLFAFKVMPRVIFY
jgi:26S proteasome regulatory subunit N2